MASGPYWNSKRGTWSVQWFDGVKWRRPTVVPKPPGFRPGSPRPKKIPAEALAAVAQYELRERQARKVPTKSATLDVGAWLEAWAEDRTGVAPLTTKQVRMAVAVFGEWCRARKITRVDQVDTGLCQEWMDERSKTIAKRSGRPIEHATLRKERGLLMAAWTEARLPNPWTHVIIPGKPSKKSRGSWTPEQFEELLDASRAWLRDILVLGVNTGIRIGALRRLEWSDVEWAKAGDPGFGWIVVRPELDKAGKGYRVPIGRKCHDVLARRRIHRDAHAVFIVTGGHGKPISPKSNNTADRIKRACARAGLPDPDSPNHHMRRTFGRWAVLGSLTGKPIPIYVVSRWMGHASVQMTEKYLQLTHDDSTRYMTDEA